ncbi:hypothetical protein ACFFIO_00205 [Citricoccus parietis]|uniref:Uncharacterized protein n=1 Tax=Citricoccus parietis TaxID=592307 RepID=A0ABV6F086_9MICC
MQVKTPLPAGQAYILGFSTGQAYRDGIALRDYERASKIRIRHGMPQTLRDRPSGRHR